MQAKKIEREKITWETSSRLRCTSHTTTYRHIDTTHWCLLHFVTLATLGKRSSLNGSHFGMAGHLTLESQGNLLSPILFAKHGWSFIILDDGGKKEKRRKERTHQTARMMNNRELSWWGSFFFFLREWESSDRENLQFQFSCSWTLFWGKEGERGGGDFCMS